MDNFSIALQSGTILLREGLEALLILAVIAAFLKRSDATVGQRASVYWGGGAAILASLVTAFIFNAFYDGAHDDRVEAGVLFLAAGLLFYMSGWLLLRQDPKVLKQELERGAAKALDSGTTFSIAALSFFSVFREGAETILFLHALAGTSGGYSFAFLAGLLTATAALALLFVAMQWLAMHLPLRPVFILTSAFLFIMGLRFIGAGIQELQEMDWVSLHNALVPAGLDIILVNPSWEAIGLQLVIGAIAAGSALNLLHRAKPVEAA
jgi:high-affinity iron transporter